MLLNAPLLIATDPSEYQDTNPYAGKTIHDKPSTPTPQDVQDYRSGAMSPASTLGDDDYVYRGCDESTLHDIEVGKYPDLKTDLHTAAGCEGSKPDEGISGREISGDVAESKSGWIGGVVGGVVVLLVAGLIIGLVVWPRRRSRVAYSDGRPPATPYPPGQHPRTAAYPPEQYPRTAVYPPERYPRTAAYPPTQHPGTAAYPPGQVPQPVPNQYPQPGAGQFPPPGSGQFPTYPHGYPVEPGRE